VIVPRSCIYRIAKKAVAGHQAAYRTSRNRATVDAQAQLYRLSSQGVQNDTRGLDDEQGELTQCLCVVIVT